MVDNKKVKLNAKQEAFCIEYLVDLNATQAAIRAGYSQKTAKDIASQNLAKLNIQARVTELKAERTKRVEINADYVLNRLVEIDQMDVLDILEEDGTLRPISNWPKSWRQFINGLDVSELSGQDGSSAVLKKIKWPDKVKNLELIGKHTQVNAWFKKDDNNDSSQVIADSLKEIAQSLPK